MIVDPILGSMSGMSPYDESFTNTTVEETKPNEQYDNSEHADELIGAVATGIILLLVFGWFLGKIVGTIGTFIQRKEEKKFNELEIKSHIEMKKLVEEWKKKNKL